MAVPVSVSAAILFPFLLYVVFADERLIPTAFQIPTIHEEEGSRVPVNPILHIMGNGEAPAPGYAISEGGLNPFLDRLSAWTGTLILVATIITLLVLDATRVSNGEHTVFWVALPGAFVVFCWDTYSGWHQRHLTRAIIERVKSSSEMATNPRCVALDSSFQEPLYPTLTCGEFAYLHKISRASTEPQTLNTKTLSKASRQLVRRFSDSEVSMHPSARLDVRKVIFPINQMHEETSLQSLASSLVKWLHVTFPTAMAVLASMPFEIIPFTLCMFVLVEALVNNGWVPVFAHGLDQWVEKTGVVGAVGGIGFLSVIIGNYLGSSVGTTILLSRVIQRWQEMRRIQGTPLSDRTFTAAVYSLAIGANFGGSTAGLLWRRELLRRNVHVDTPQYARVNLPIMAVNMTVACLVLVGQVYITRSNDPSA